MIFTVNGKRYRWNPLKLLETVAGMVMMATMFACAFVALAGGL